MEIHVNDINCSATVQNVCPMAKKRLKLQLTERPQQRQTGNCREDSFLVNELLHVLLFITLFSKQRR